MRSIKQRWLGLLISCLLILAPFAQLNAGQTRLDIVETVELMSSFTDSFQKETALKNNEQLASDNFEGRQSGTEAVDKAANWIGEQFKSYGLQPFDKTSYFQEFPVTYYDVTAPLLFSIKTAGRTIHPVYRSDFVVYPISGSGKASSQVVFAGYGITSDDPVYDDYAGIDVNGKIVLVISGTPSFISSSIYERYDTSYKIENALNHHAAGVILASQPEGSILVPMNMKYASGYPAELPCLYISKPTTELFFENHPNSLPQLIDSIQNNKTPASVVLPVSAEFEVHVVLEKRSTNNVIGYIPAIDPNSEESIVIGSHYDHLGKDLITGDIYRGANDNASGTAVMMELARAIQSLPIAVNVNIVFIAFSGEEEGLIGSQYYVKQPLFPLKKIKAMINLDMVGTGDGILLAGTSSSRYPELTEAVEESAKMLDIAISVDDSLLYPGSDHYPFHMNKIPSLFFFQDNPGKIGGYHTLKDTMDSIDPDNLEDCGVLAMLTALTYSQAIWMEFLPPKQSPRHPKLKLTGTIYSLDDNNLYISIGDYILPADPYEPFEIWMPLQSGDNTVEFSLIDDEDQIFKRFSFHLQVDIDQNLIADFNQDFDVDIKDLTLLARYYGMSAPLYQFRSQFDCNLDQVINDQDLAILESVYGYFVH